MKKRQKITAAERTDYGSLPGLQRPTAAAQNVRFDKRLRLHVFASLAFRRI
jgi:hypothetical protein